MLPKIFGRSYHQTIEKGSVDITTDSTTANTQNHGHGRLMVLLKVKYPSDHFQKIQQD